MIYATGWIVGWPALMFLMAEPLRNLGKYTFADVVAFRLKQTPVRLAAACGGILTLLFYTIAQMVGAGNLVALMFGLRYEAAVAIVGGVMLLYVLFGGMLATTWVQIIKAVLLLSGVTLLTILVLLRFDFSPVALYAAVAARYGQAALEPGGLVTDPIEAISLGLALMFGLLGLPHILMRFYTVPDSRAARGSVLYATGFIGYFYLIVPIVGFGAAALVGREAIRRIDAGGNMTRALFSWRYEWDWKAAEREFEYAIALAPSNDTIRCYHSNYLAWRGRRADAVAELTKSRELNPGASFSSSESAIYFQLRDYPGLIRVSQAGVHSDPNEWLEHFFLGMGYEGVGRRAEAIPEYRKAVEISGGDQDATAALAHAYAMDGRTADAKAILRDLEQKHDGYVSPYMIATIHAGLGDKDRAFEYLTKAYQERCLDIVWQLQADHRIDNLRSDPRFQTLLRHVNFP